MGLMDTYSKKYHNHGEETDDEDDDHDHGDDYDDDYNEDDVGDSAQNGNG